MPCGLMNESSFGFLNEGVITKGLTEWKSHMYAMWPKQWKHCKDMASSLTIQQYLRDKAAVMTMTHFDLREF